MSASQRSLKGGSWKVSTSNFLHAHSDLEPVSGRKCYRCSVFFRYSMFHHWFMESSHDRMLACWGRELANDDCGLPEVRNHPRRRFMESPDLQFWTHIGAMNQVPKENDPGLHEVRD